MGDDSGIKLVGGELFHSKLVYIKTTVEEHIVIGSINMTNNGTNKAGNEELFLHSKKPPKSLVKQAKTYFELLDEQGYTSWIDNCNRPSKGITIRDFFLDGSLYVRFTASNLLSFHLNLPEDMRKASAKLSPIIDAEAKNSFSMLNLLQKDILCDLLQKKKTAQPQYVDNDLLQFINGKDLKHIKNEDSAFDKKKNIWTTYCIETLHGYWAPNFLCKYIDDILSEKENTDSKFAKIQKVVRLLKKPAVEELVCIFFDMLSEKITSLGGEWNVEDAKKRWDDWRDRLHGRVIGGESDSKIDESLPWRLNSGVYKSKLLDIFVDNEHTNEFIDSVLNFFHSSLTRQTKNKIVNIIKELKVKLDKASHLEEIINGKGENSFMEKLRVIHPKDIFLLN